LARILVVDDSAVVRRMLGLVLQRAGHDVSFAMDGSEGLSATRALSPDLVITDLEMPVLDGIGLVRGLRADATCAEVPIIMLTASAEEVHRDAVDGIDVDGFATKPLRSDQVLDLVATVLARGARRSR
jgi:two-component system chemotaxis response regulator CheY